MARCKCGRNDYGSVPGGPKLVVCNSCGTYYANDDAGGKPVTVGAKQRAELDKARADAKAEKAATMARAEAPAPDGVPALPSNQYYCASCRHGHLATSRIGLAHASAP